MTNDRDAGAVARRRGDHRRDDDSAGFALVEIIVASVILMLIVTSFANMMIDSLSTALLTRQRESAVSTASNVAENAEALGQSGLAVVVAGNSTCTSLTVQTVRVITAATASTFDQCFTVTLDRTTFTVTPTVTIGSPDIVSVTVTWGSPTHSYLTSTNVGS